MLRILLFILITMILKIEPATAFDLPEIDPWFYQSTEQGYVFWVPDKAQHFYGSVLIGEIGKQLPFPMQKVSTPVLAVSIGLFYELWQENRGIGFSKRDLFADILGVATSRFSTNSFKMWMDYSTSEKTITFNVRKLFG